MVVNIETAGEVAKSNEILIRALEFYIEGIVPLPVTRHRQKAPAVSSWTQYQKEMPSKEQIVEWFAKADGLGVLCGEVSGNLYMIELEGRAANLQTLDLLTHRARENGILDIFEKLNSGYVERSPSGGLHWLLRSDGLVGGNEKFASRVDDNGVVQVLAESRGEGGFVVVAPTPGICHPSGNAWRIIKGDAKSIPVFTHDEFDALRELFISIDETPRQQFQEPVMRTRIEGQVLPGDDFNARMNWDEILIPDGWTKLHTDPMGKTDWRRPGKDYGISATTNYAGNDLLHIFTSSVALDSDKSYTKFAYTALTKFGGDFHACATALRAQGYGKDAPVSPPSLEVEVEEESESIADSSWLPRQIIETDLADEPPPSMLRREDGNCLLYAGKVNAIFGESESGKTWLALEAIRQELEKNNIVFYLDFEDSARGILNRLKTMRVPTDKFKFFRYANPDEKIEVGVAALMRQEILAYQPTLIVVDGVNAAMNLLGLDLEKNKDATYFSQTVLRPLRVGGAGILTIDHVTKSKDNRGNYAIGAQAKRADVDGAAFAVSVALPFGRGIDGALDITCTKDRPGFVRAICPDAKTVGVANLRSLPDGGISVSISGGTVKISTREQKMEAVCELLRKHGYEMNRNQLADKLRDEGIGIKDTELKYVLDGLVATGALSHRKDGQKFLYGYQSDFFANDVSVWTPDV